MKTIYFDDVIEGGTSWGGECDVDKEEMVEYARRNDPWPFHVDEEAAGRSPFGGLVASGGYTIALWYRLGHPLLNQREGVLAFLGGLEWKVKFAHPVRPGDHLRYKTTWLDKKLSRKPGRGIVRSLGELINQEEKTVLSVEATYLVATGAS
jgi:acyl dehydratase